VLRFLRTLTLMTAALAAAVIAYTLVTLPPRARLLPAPLAANIVYGAYHIHTTLSDGRATPDEVAAAAARAGLAFVILTDHGDATRAPAAPAYRHGVLVIDAVEISTASGHLVALGLGSAAPYPLGGDPRDVVDDVHRLGGWIVLAHPDSPKPELRWHAAPGNGSVEYDAIEWLNADSLWREPSRPDLLRVLARALVRPPESLATLLDRAALARTLQRWDAALRSRSVAGLSAVDAHGVPGWRGAYEQEFRAVAQAAVLDGPLTHDAAADARRVLAALRAGHAFSIVTAFARPAAIEITASDGHTSAGTGGRIAAPAEDAVTIEARVAGVPDARLVLFHNGRAVASGYGDVRVSGPPDPGSYRAEAYVGGSAAPWIVSNAVSIGPEDSRALVPVSPAATIYRLRGDDRPAWTIEHGPSSDGTFTAGGADLEFSYRVGTAAPGREFVALARGMSDPTQAFDRVQFIARADRPMRLSVQLRFPGGPDGQRWVRSVYLDETPRPIVVMLTDLLPVASQGTLRPVVARVQSVLFVVDTLNTTPGAAGHVWFREIALGNPLRFEPNIR
jgi:hypothetical protein